MTLALLLLLLIGVPLGELYVLIRVGGSIGAFPTLYLVVLTAVVGIWLVRRQGFSILSRIHAALDRGEAPAIEVVEGGLVLIAGLALLVPGFVTDLVGFALLVPPLRDRIVRRLIRKWQATGAPAEGRQRGPHVIEGDWRRVDDARSDLPEDTSRH
jgi:UPF0716 protein FxsA